MKPVLVAVDYSEISHALIRYAMEFATALQSKIELLHVFQIPVVATDAYAFVPEPSEINKIKLSHEKKLAEIAEEIKREYNLNCNFSAHCNYGLPGDGILNHLQESPSEFVIVGLQGMGYLAEHLLGSTTSHLFKNSPIPVLALHKNCRFKPFDNAVFAYDNKMFENRQLLKPFISLCKQFGTHIHVLSIISELEEFPTPASLLQSNELDPGIPMDHTSFHILENKSIVEGLKAYCEQMNIDVLVLVPRQHGFLYSLFHNSTSKKAAFNIHLPILAIHD